MTTTTTEPTMEQQARALAADLDREVELIQRLRNLGRADDAAEERSDELAERPYGISLSTTIEVELYGGGPAGGIHFEVERTHGGYGWQWTSARAWHQDWFQPKGWQTLDDATADYLFELWGLAAQVQRIVDNVTDEDGTNGADLVDAITEWLDQV